jgi:hypothetical protein
VKKKKKENKIKNKNKNKKLRDCCEACFVHEAFAARRCVCVCVPCAVVVIERICSHCWSSFFNAS